MKLKVKRISNSIDRKVLSSSLTPERISLKDTPQFYDVIDNNGVLIIQGLNKPVPSEVKINGCFHIGNLKLQLVSSEEE